MQSAGTTSLFLSLSTHITSGGYNSTQNLVLMSIELKFWPLTPHTGSTLSYERRKIHDNTSSISKSFCMLCGWYWKAWWMYFNYTVSQAIVYHSILWHAPKYWSSVSLKSLRTLKPVRKFSLSTNFSIACRFYSSIFIQKKQTCTLFQLLLKKIWILISNIWTTFLSTRTKLALK